ncbi:MotA/TolQ/ExbB proton channel family protein [Leucobacter weissii]|uniref:MotA/TolQ/ExbB proton channel family protein n=1 Tax=Leucobacter weissii TaxID=1983706 RepID=A0A939MJ38_9MICO|nr:MotA/TolQ/ExbB proton channel family protein [Leucobacter weissii]MBO1901673.1 MotA/TolQ/ExbB proton channel family protein [Leucobacter weissii]
MAVIAQLGSSADEGAELVEASGVVSDTLSLFSSALGDSMHVLILVMLVVLVFEFGRIVAEGWRRVRPGSGSNRLEHVAREALARPEGAGELARKAPGPLAERAVLGLGAAARGAALDADGGAAAFEAVLADYELAVQRRLGAGRLLVRAGPAAGLMGTLIPLTPGLAELGEGNFQLLAEHLQVAFAATVIGLLVGTAAFAITQVRMRLYSEDLIALERAVAKHVQRPSAVVPVAEPAHGRGLR